MDWFKMDNKGNFTLEIVVVGIIILLALGITSFVSEVSQEKISKSVEENNIEKTINEVADNLINDPGTPINWEDFKSKNEGTYYFFTRYGHKPHSSFDYSNKDEEIYLIFGKESTGIPKEILRTDLDRCMRIPMSENVRSLNLSNCAAIVLYEVLRQQEYRDLLRDEPHKDKDFIIKD